jgi:hypothetical protein
MVNTNHLNYLPNKSHISTESPYSLRMVGIQFKLVTNELVLLRSNVNTY